MDVWMAAIFLGMHLLASIQDIRTREVDDRFWWISLGIGAFSALRDGGLEALACSAGPALMCASALAGGRSGPALLAAGCASWAACIACLGSDPGFRPILLEPVFILLFYLAYRTGVVRGGADAKCLMAMTVAIPENGLLPGPLALMLPPSVWILFSASVALLAAGGAWILLEGGIRDFPCIRMPASRAMRTFAAVAEDTGGLDDEEHLERAAADGDRDVLVSPTFPFIPFLTAGAALWMAASVAMRSSHATCSSRICFR